MLALGAVALAATVDDSQGNTLCIFRRCTGGYCPGCGGSRSVLALLRGDLDAAWTIHPWVPLMVLQAVALGAVALWNRRSITLSRVTAILAANIVIGVAIWVVRLLQGSIPVPFA